MFIKHNNIYDSLKYLFSMIQSTLLNYFEKLSLS